MSVNMTLKPSPISLFAEPATNTNTWRCCCEKFTSTTRHQRKPLSRRTSKSALLTGQQRLTILRTWHRLSGDLVTLGIATMNRMIYVDSKSKYPFKFRFKVGQQLQEDPGFRQHAFWCIQVINAVVDNLDQLDDTVVDMFLEIGSLHAGLPLFSHNYFSLLPDVWGYVWDENLKGRFSVQAANAWRSVFQYVESLLVEGYESSSLKEEPEARGFEDDVDEVSFSGSSRTVTESEVDEDPSVNDLGVGAEGSFLSASNRNEPHSRSSSVGSTRRSGQPRSTRATFDERPSDTPSYTTSQPYSTRSIFFNFSSSYDAKSPASSRRSSPAKPAMYDRASLLTLVVRNSPTAAATDSPSPATSDLSDTIESNRLSPKSDSDDGCAPCTVVEEEGSPKGNRSRAGSFPLQKARSKQKPKK